MSINCRKVDFSESVNEFRDFVDSIRFKRGECGKHFKKHGEQLNGVGFEVGDNDSYLSKAQQCLIDTIFKRGFVFCSEDGEQLAFFMTLNQKKEPSYEGALFNINEPMVSIGKIDDGTFRFHTFYIANGKTAGLSLRHSSYKYVAIFENGVAEAGWQKLEQSQQYGTVACKAGETVTLSQDRLIKQSSKSLNFSLLFRHD